MQGRVEGADWQAVLPPANRCRAFPLLLDCRSEPSAENEERCPPRQESRVERLKAKVGPLLT